MKYFMGPETWQPMVEDIEAAGHQRVSSIEDAEVYINNAPNPRRIVSGVDGARVAMLLAVLEKRAAIRVSDQDVYVSTVGGVRFTEPAADLAIAIAVAGDRTVNATMRHDLALAPDGSPTRELVVVLAGLGEITSTYGIEEILVVIADDRYPADDRR